MSIYISNNNTVCLQPNNVNLTTLTIPIKPNHNNNRKLLLVQIFFYNYPQIKHLVVHSKGMMIEACVNFPENDLCLQWEHTLVLQRLLNFTPVSWTVLSENFLVLHVASIFLFCKGVRGGGLWVSWWIWWLLFWKMDHHVLVHSTHNNTMIEFFNRIYITFFKFRVR